ncbi:MAG: DUF3617 domain-containing protein [Sphingomonadaceae bacterium]
MHKFFLLSAAALALSACADKGADTNGDGKISDSEAATEMADGGAMAMKPGLWEVKIGFDNIEAPGAPAAMQKTLKTQMGQGVTQRSCLTQAQVDKPGMEFFGAQPEANCTFEALDRSTAGVKMAMTCKPAGPIIVKSKMDGKFSAETYTMRIEQNTDGTPMGAVKMTGKIEGTRVGDCPA